MSSVKFVKKYTWPNESIVWTQHRQPISTDAIGAAFLSFPIMIIALVAFIMTLMSILEYTYETIDLGILIYVFIFLAIAFVFYTALRFFLSEFNIHYGVTDRAAYIINSTWPTKYKRYGAEAISKMRFDEKSFYFGEYCGPDLKTGQYDFCDMECFRDIKDPKFVIKALEDILENEGYEFVRSEP